MEMPKPTADHKRLEKLAGIWKGTETLFPSPWDPKGGQAEGTTRGRVCLSGFAVVIDYEQSRGGKTTWTNVVAACHPCNRKKGSRSLEKCGMTLLKPPRRPAWKELIDDYNREAASDWLPYLEKVG